MGEGYGFTCQKCGKNYEVLLGIGFAFPFVYEETVKKIQKGKYGAKAKKLFQNEPFAAVDCETGLFKCECGNWKAEEIMDFYVPKDREKIKAKEYGRWSIATEEAEEHIGKTVEEIGHIPYVSQGELQDDFQLVFSLPHVCKKCKKEMKRIKHPDSYVMRYGLSCPKCGAKNRFDPRHTGMILWD